MSGHFNWPDSNLNFGEREVSYAMQAGVIHSRSGSICGEHGWVPFRVGTLLQTDSRGGEKRKSWERGEAGRSVAGDRQMVGTKAKD